MCWGLPATFRMVYDKNPRKYGDGLDGVWRCPFTKEWVERMRMAVKHCEPLNARQVAAAYDRIGSGYYYKVLPGDFLDEPQDARGLPLSYCCEEEWRYRNHPTCCTAIYDYDSVPDMVISNDHDDWPLRMWEPVLTA